MILREPAHFLDPRVRRRWSAAAAIVVVAAVVIVSTGFAVATVAGWEDDLRWFLLTLAVCLLLVVGTLFVVVEPRIRYAHYRYEVTEHGLYVAHGWLWRRWQIVPHARLQTVDTSAGVLDRTFGLVVVEVTTAAAAGGTRVPGLDRAVADALVNELAQRAGIDEGT